ncbi:aspartyl protease [Ancylostoma caninum]|uniref:Aspartyl protease n=1 Tax=Ancylostoma caninum TaxID=29170 RepID=A0A368GIL7_ANCCA|nr:aspartyl protease [Ancylostoma caninum]
MHRGTLQQLESISCDSMRGRKNNGAMTTHCPQLVNINDPDDRGSLTLSSEKASRMRLGEIQQIEHLDKRLKRAITSFPECFAKTPMLYLQAQIHGREVLALVDTGAQASIISHETVEKCQMTDAVDKRFCVFANGVGGTRSSLGRILAC